MRALRGTCRGAGPKPALQRSVAQVGHRRRRRAGGGGRTEPTRRGGPPTPRTTRASSRASSIRAQAAIRYRPATDTGKLLAKCPSRPPPHRSRDPVGLAPGHARRGVDRPRRPRRTPSRKDRPVTRPGSRRILVSAGDPERPGHRRRARMAHSFAILGVALSGTLPAIVLAVAGVAGEASLRERLAAASPERGQKVFRVCSACHSIDEGAAHTIGPNLWGVVGRPVAAAEGFGRYTPAMLSFGGIWSAERLDRYLRQPMVEIEGTAMVFPGIASDVDRADLIVWLDRNSPAPADFVSKHAAPEGRGAAQGTPGGEAVAPRPIRPPRSRRPRGRRGRRGDPRLLHRLPLRTDRRPSRGSPVRIGRSCWSRWSRRTA